MLCCVLLSLLLLVLLLLNKLKVQIKRKEVSQMCHADAAIEKICLCVNKTAMSLAVF